MVGKQIIEMSVFSSSSLFLSLIPVKLMQEWMELFFSGKPLYEVASVDPAPADPTPEQIIELEKLQILNNQDYNEYVVRTCWVTVALTWLMQSICDVAFASESWVK